MIKTEPTLRSANPFSRHRIARSSITHLQFQLKGILRRTGEAQRRLRLYCTDLATGPETLPARQAGNEAIVALVWRVRRASWIAMWRNSLTCVTDEPSYRLLKKWPKMRCSVAFYRYLQ